MENKTKTKSTTKEERQNNLFDSLMTGDEKTIQYKHVDVEKKGTVIIIPEGMDYDSAMEWLDRKKHSEEKIISFKSSMKAYPYDGAYALHRAAQELFGYADLTATGPSKDTPPEMINIKLPDGSYAEVPWGRMCFPGLDDDCYVDTSFNNQTMEFIISGQIKRKFEPIMQKLSDKTRDILKTSSIYKGTAIRVDLDFMDTADKAPTHPEFMELGDISDSSILLSEQFKLEYSSVLLRIEKTRECYNKNITLKHGCLLAGPYGTGKTLTARWTAKKAVDNRWTYLYVENSTQLRHALRLAELYAPAVVFTEDIDKAMEGDRSVKMNEILNTLDGIDTKSHPIITILTTNHVENINKAFLRAGRIDKLIHMGPLDKDTALKFINQFTFDESGESMLIQDEDFNEAAEALAGIVPAFASEVISQAKMYSLYKTGDFNKITSDDIKYAAQSFKDHIKLTENKKILSKEEEVGKTFSSLFESVTNNLQDAINDIKDDLNDLRDRL